MKSTSLPRLMYLIILHMYNWWTDDSATDDSDPDDSDPDDSDPDDSDPDDSDWPCFKVGINYHFLGSITIRNLDKISDMSSTLIIN